MRGRYELSNRPEELRGHFDLPAAPEFDVALDVRPTQAAPIVRQSYASDAHAPNPLARECVLARWGLVPPWAKDTRFGLRCINARAETVDRLPAFRVAYRHRRCLVPLNAYFEWGGDAQQQVRWRISLGDHRLFALGGLWERWVDGASGATLDSFTIVTCKANPTIAQVHGRMPVIVPRDAYNLWLDARHNPRALLAPFAAEPLQLERVQLPDENDERIAAAA